MLQAPTPDDYVLATGECHSVREFITHAGTAFGFNIVFEGTNENERAIDRKTGRTLVAVNPAFFRPAEVDRLLGNPAKAERALGWRRAMSFEDLVTTMAEADDRRVRDRNDLV